MLEGKIRRWIVFAYMSIGLNIFLAAGKLITAFYTASFFLCIHGFYNMGLAAAKIVSLRHYAGGKAGMENEAVDEEAAVSWGGECYHSVGGILMATSLFYIIYAMRLFAQLEIAFPGYGQREAYAHIISIGMAAVAFAELGVAVYGILIARKSRIPAFISLKMISLVSALVAIDLCQTSLLSLYYKGDPSFYNGVSGVAFGIVFMMMGMYMVFGMGLYRPGFVRNK